MMTMSRAMPWSFLRGPIIGVLLGALLLQAGCSALRLGYSQGPSLAYWWVDSYLDLDDEQARHVRAATDDWFRWHRAAELPGYVKLLQRAQADALVDMTPAQACRWADEIAARLRTAYQAAVPAMAEAARTLTTQQLRHLERRHAKNNEEYRSDYLQESPEERLEAQVERVVERAESFYGRLDSQQRQRVARWMADSPFDADLWFAERRRRQLEIVHALQRVSTERLPTSEAQATLGPLVEHMFRSPRDSYRAYQQRLAEYNCAFAAELHNLTTPEQRRHAANKFKGWEDDLRAVLDVKPTRPDTVVGTTR